jgi:hypothetical protein
MSEPRPEPVPVIRAGSFLVAPRGPEEVDPEEERLHPWQRWLRLSQMLRELAARTIDNVNITRP